METRNLSSGKEILLKGEKFLSNIKKFVRIFRAVADRY